MVSKLLKKKYFFISPFYLYEAKRDSVFSLSPVLYHRNSIEWHLIQTDRQTDEQWQQQTATPAAPEEEEEEEEEQTHVKANVNGGN